MRPTLRRLAAAVAVSALFAGVFATAATAASAAPASPATTQVTREMDDWSDIIDWNALFCWIGLPVCDDDDDVLPDDPGDGDGDDGDGGAGDGGAGDGGAGDGGADIPGILPADPGAPVTAGDGVAK